jgi:hypothetical protein
MPSFNENVDIRGHDLVVYDDSNTEIARLDHEGNLVVHDELEGSGVGLEILKFLAEAAELTVGAPGRLLPGQEPPGSPVDIPPVFLAGRSGTVRVMGRQDGEAVLLRGDDARVEIGSQSRVSGRARQLGARRRACRRCAGGGVRRKRGQSGIFSSVTPTVATSFAWTATTGRVSVGVDGAEGHLVVRTRGRP